MQESRLGGRDLLRTAAAVEGASLELRSLLHSPVLRTLADPLAVLLAGAPGLDVLEDALSRLAAPTGDVVRRGARPGPSARAADQTPGAGRGIAGGDGGMKTLAAALAGASGGDGGLRALGAALAGASGGNRSTWPSTGPAGRAARRSADPPSGVIPEPQGWRSGSAAAGGRSGARVAAAIAGVAQHNHPSSRSRKSTGEVPAPSALPTLTTPDLAAAAGLRSGSGPSAPSGEAAPWAPPSSEAPREPNEPITPRELGSRLPSVPAVAPTPPVGGALGELVTRWQQGSGVPTVEPVLATGVPSTPRSLFDQPAAVDDQAIVERVERAVDAMLRREAEQHGLNGVDQ